MDYFIVIIFSIAYCVDLVLLLFIDLYIWSIFRCIPLYRQLLTQGLRVHPGLFTTSKNTTGKYVQLSPSWPSECQARPRAVAQLSMGLLKKPLPVSLWLLRHSPPQCKSRSSWRPGCACDALKLKRVVNQSSPHRNYTVGSRGGVRNSFYENAKHGLLKETHCRKMKKCQFALKQNRNRNILTIWQKTFPYKYIKSCLGVRWELHTALFVPP